MRAVDSAQRFVEAPRLSALQVEALDLFDALLDDPRLHFKMLLEPGDLQFCYNHTLLHDRCAFQDHLDVGSRRQLFRLWLSPPGDRPLPESFCARFGKYFCAITIVPSSLSARQNLILVGARRGAGDLMTCRFCGGRESWRDSMRRNGTDGAADGAAD